MLSSFDPTEETPYTWLTATVHDPKARLLTEQRRRSVLDLVDQDAVTVVDMVRRSPFLRSLSATTRRARFYRRSGAIACGAVRRLEATQDYPLAQRNSAPDEKIRIGRAAAELVRPGETIILDSGTTRRGCAPFEKNENSLAYVITNALNIASN